MPNYFEGWIFISLTQLVDMNYSLSLRRMNMHLNFQ